MDELIPSSYASWRHCIEVSCGIPLTGSYIERRIAALQDPRDHQTRRFIELWGAEHHARVLGWFREALAQSNS